MEKLTISDVLQFEELWERIELFRAAFIGTNDSRNVRYAYKIVEETIKSTSHWLWTHIHFDVLLSKTCKTLGKTTSKLAYILDLVRHNFGNSGVEMQDYLKQVWMSFHIPNVAIAAR